MNNSSGGWRGLGGASKKEATREDVLQQAKAERAARAAARQQHRAATIIAACFRGHAARRKLRQSLLAEWHSKFAVAAAQQDAQPLPAADAAAMRLLLMALLPLGSTHSKRLLASGEPPAAVAAPGVSSALRGTLALLLRHKHAPAEPELQSSWQLQAGQLCLLCCLVTAAGSSTTDMLLGAAATRLLQRMTSQDYWAGPSHSSSNSSSQGLGAAAVLARLAAHPAPLMRALQRLVSNTTPPGPTAQPAAGGLNAAAVTASSLQRLITVMTLLLDGSSSLGGQRQQQFVDAAVLLGLTTPGLAAALPAASRAQLAQQHLMQVVLLPAAQALAESGSLAGTAAVHCLANFCQLLTGCGPTPLPQRQAALSSMSDCCLAHTGVAGAYVNTAISLLCSANRKPSGRHHCSPSSQQQRQQQQQPAAEVLADGCSMLGTRQHLVQLLQVLSSNEQQQQQQQQQDGLVLWAAYCVHLLQDGEQLQARPDAAASGPGTAAARGLPAAVLNVLSFAPDLLPRLWRWLAMNAGLPLEAPLQAVVGLDIAAVACGPDGLPPHVALVMGLLVRSLAQLLLVLDDADLHRQQKPFSLGTSRAIASTLNSLVFHTCFPEQRKSPQQQWQRQQAPGAAAPRLAAATAAHGRALLARHAAGCLREWYDRDARQQFCQPNLWTEPYSNLMAAQQQATTTAAVVQALLVGVGLGADEAAAAPLAAPAPAAAGSSGGGGGSLRTAALLSLLRSAPQCVPFDVRLEMFRQMLGQDKVAGRWSLSPMEGGPRPIKLTVRRDALLEDAFRGLAAAGSAIKARLQVTFVNAAGLEEAGLDQGGLMKELLEQAVLAATQPEYGLFMSTENTGLLFPNPAAEAIPQGLALLEFVGLLVGKALYEGILLDLCFAPFFVRSLQGGRPGLDDLATLDASLHANLVSLKSCPADDVQHLGLTFLAEQQLLGRTIESELLPGGASLPVTAENRLMYIHLLADWHLNARLGRTAAAFARGLSGVLAPSWLKLFSPAELNELISGGRGSALDVADMARYARYSNGYSATSSTVKMFWRVVAEMTPDQRSALLRFITSTSKAPLGGFKHLNPPLTIHRVDCGSSPLAFLGGKDVDRLPSASTCFNMLKLPNYKRAATMKQRLLFAISSSAGFELS